ncbi:unnamed protein product [Pedinophyceae sp. YPF-701]|nr:unnamed protein product [Pedinophyceae sp. YPF-701]
MAAPDARKRRPDRDAEQQEAGQDDGDPEDITMIKNVLKSMGVEEFEPGVVDTLLQYAYRHVTDVVESAAVIAGQARRERKDVTYDDLKLALRMQQGLLQGHPPTAETLKAMAGERNGRPLPVVARPGQGPASRVVGLDKKDWQTYVRLPAEDRCTVMPNYRPLKLKESRENP